jgi:uncharacterized surface protein with fasciclin (FAS1) repeats
MRIVSPSRAVRGAVLSLSLLLATTALTASFSVPSASAQAQRDIVETAVAAGQFNTLAQALQAGGLVDTLKGPGPFTVFAPNDAAFGKVPQANLGQTLQNQQLLRSVLTYHVTAGRLSAADLASRQQVASVQGGPLMFMTGPARVNGANIVAADIQASNGVIHVIDTVLTPPGAGVMAGMAPAPAPGQMPRTGYADSETIPLALALLGLATLAMGGLFLMRRSAAGGIR